MGTKRWYCSKNLKEPTVKTKDGIYTRRGIARIAKDRVDDRQYWECKYKGYRFVSATPVYNEFNGWWYLYVKMYRDKHINTNTEKQRQFNLPLSYKS